MRHISTSIALTLIMALASACDIEGEPHFDGEPENEEFFMNDSDIIDISEFHGLVSSTPDIIDGLEPVGYDEERKIYVYDQDGDGVPDITEEIDGTDMNDPDSSMHQNMVDAGTAQEGGFPTSSCRSGFRQVGSRLCASTSVETSREYRYAVNVCRTKLSHVCTYEDLNYLYANSSLDGSYDPLNKHLGGMTGDDQILCGNKSITFNGDPDWSNFEGVCSKNNSRQYFCCHDDE